MSACNENPARNAQRRRFGSARSSPSSFAQKPLYSRPMIVDTLAEVAARLSRCAEAVRLEKRAVSMIRSDAKFKARLDEIQARCAKALPAATH